MHSTPITREDLPYFEVESIEEGPIIPATEEHSELRSWKIHGRVSDPRIIHPESWCIFLGPGRNCLTGGWGSGVRDDGAVEFQTCDPPENLTAGFRMRFAGQLHGKIAILVEDGPSAWDARIFISRNAVATKYVNAEGQSWRILRPLDDGESVQPDAEVIEGGWDHEHCAICNEHIDPGDRFFQHKFEGDYLCVSCFEKYVPTGDLSFLVLIGLESA